MQLIINQTGKEKTKEEEEENKTKNLSLFSTRWKGTNIKIIMIPFKQLKTKMIIRLLPSLKKIIILRLINQNNKSEPTFGNYNIPNNVGINWEEI